MSNQKKFKQLVSGKSTETVKRNARRIKDRAQLRESQAIALKVLLKLDELGWTQKKLAEILGVTPQQVSKLVSGKENLTLETQTKLQDTLDIPILATYYEKRVHSQDTILNRTVHQTYLPVKEERKSDKSETKVVPIYAKKSKQRTTGFKSIEISA